MLKFLSKTALLLAGLTTTALATESHEIVLQHGSVSTIEIDANVGDTVRFVHKDEDGIHALYLEDEQHRFDLSDMKHGDHYDLTLKHAGKLSVRCHVMDNMTVVINVTE